MPENPPLPNNSTPHSKLGPPRRRLTRTSSALRKSSNQEKSQTSMGGGHRDREGARVIAVGGKRYSSFHLFCVISLVFGIIAIIVMICYFVLFAAMDGYNELQQNCSNKELLNIDYDGNDTHYVYLKYPRLTGGLLHANCLEINKRIVTGSLGIIFGVFQVALSLFNLFCTLDSDKGIALYAISHFVLSMGWIFALVFNGSFVERLWWSKEPREPREDRYLYESVHLFQGENHSLVGIATIVFLQNYVFCVATALIAIHEYFQKVGSGRLSLGHISTVFVGSKPIAPYGSRMAKKKNSFRLKRSSSVDTTSIHSKALKLPQPPNTTKS